MCVCTPDGRSADSLGPKFLVYVHPGDERCSIWYVSLDSRGIATLDACVSPNDDPHTVEHLIRSNSARFRAGESPGPPRPIPIGVGGHLGDDFQESGGLARRLDQRQFESTWCYQNDLYVSCRSVVADRSADGLVDSRCATSPNPCEGRGVGGLKGVFRWSEHCGSLC